MKIKRCFYVLLALLFATTLLACGEEQNNGGNNWVAPSTPMQICVGSESTWYYQDVLDQYVEDNNLPFTIEVTGVDTGSYADTFLLDPEAGADIFVAAHDNLGKLLEGAGSIAPIEDEDLIDQIDETVDPEFQDVVYIAAGGGQARYYAVPIIRQSLVLYYNKAYFSDASECDTWEEILKVAKDNNKLAVAYTGNDGFNYSHWLLAQPANTAAKNAFGNKGSLQLYKNGLWANNMLYGDDQVAITKYAQEFTANANGRKGEVVGQNTWESELKNNQVITVIGGAWNVGSIESVLGKGGYGITVLPKFTLKSSHAYGTAKANMQFQSGSFYDVKCLMKKKGSAYAPFLDEIMMFLASDEIQEGSYINCNNLPASMNVDLESDEVSAINIELAKAQIAQGEAAGIPQPFGYDPLFNPAYYGKASTYFVELHQNLDGDFTSKANILARLKYISYILAKNEIPTSQSEVDKWAK